MGLCNTEKDILWGFMKKLKKRSGILVRAVCVAAVAFLACFAGYAAGTGVLPLNTIEDVAPEAPSFSKNDFVGSLQEALRTGTISDALSLYGSLPADYAEDTDLLLLKASLLISDSRFDDAKKICMALNAKDASNTDAIELLAYIAKLQGNSAERTKQIKLLLAKDAYNPAANMELAQDYFDNKNYTQARLYYKKALVREPDNEDALFGLGQSDYFLGAKDSSKDKEAEKTFRKILEKDPAYAPAYSYLGKIASANNEYRRASEQIKKAIEIDPTNYDYFMDYGTYERYLGHYEVAEEAWTKAISIQPDYFLAYAYRAGLYDEQDKYDLALLDYENVLKYNPQYYFANESIGVLAIHQKQWKKARLAFEKCMEMDKTGNISYPLMVTYCYYMEKDKLGAKKFSDKVLRKLDRNSIDYAMLRVFHDEAGEMPLPQKINAIDNSNKKGKMYFYLGLFYDMFGGIEAAKQFYTKVVDMKSPMFFEYRLAEWRMEADAGSIKTN